GQALGAARSEILMMLGLWLSAWGVSHSTTSLTQGPDRFAWIVVLLIQSVPYASSVIVSWASAFALPAHLVGRRGYRQAGTLPVTPFPAAAYPAQPAEHPQQPVEPS